MSGHNKWSKVKHKKAAADTKKSQEFSRLAQLITIESRKSEGDRSSAGLAGAIAKAKSVNMPNDNIERAIARGFGNGSKKTEKVVYESYGPGGSALIIEVTTDNKNRSISEIRHILSKYNMVVAAQGSAVWAFDNGPDGYKPTTTVSLPKEYYTDLEKIIEDLKNSDDVDAVYSNAVPIA